MEICILGATGLVGNELVPTNGDPIVMKSDFYYLSDTLDDLLDTLHAEIAQHDVDGDNRLRTGHPVESNGLDPDGLDAEVGEELVDPGIGVRVGLAHEPVADGEDIQLARHG